MIIPITHFNLSEFNCKDGSKTPQSAIENLNKVMKALEIIRLEAKSPIKINSGYRSIDYNKKIGGAKNSQHCLGNAADIVISGKTPKEVYRMIEVLINKMKIPEGGLGLYPTFVHYDIRGTKCRW